MRAGICVSCRPIELRGFDGILVKSEPTHCYSRGNDPGLKGLIGSGFSCTCWCGVEPCPWCNDEGVVCDMAGEIIGPCACGGDEIREGVE